MTEPICPVCLNAHEARAEICQRNGRRRVDCSTCGSFVIYDEAREDYLEQGNDDWLNPVKRAAISHRIRTRRGIPTPSNGGLPALDSPTLKRFEREGVDLPPTSRQADNILRYVGDHERAQGADLRHTPPYAVVGSASPHVVSSLLNALKDEGLLQRVRSSNERVRTKFCTVSLSLAGWRVWEELKQGSRSSRDGFIAMQFGDDRLDNFIDTVLRPGVNKHLGVSVDRIDSPGKTRAGLIDNLMREAIEDAAFVLVELSHGNRGAYWEAGLAEGLRKPVIYLCEKSAWDDPETRPHFDVNHRVTVMWEEDKPDEFVRTLVATIRNSLRSV